MTSTGATAADVPAQREDEPGPRGRVVVMARDRDVRTKTARALRRRYDRDYLLSAQVGWKLEPALDVRVGLFESTGGVGADYRFGERIQVTGEAFDFGKKRDDNPHLRLFGEYVFRHERPHTPQLFVTSGVDNPLNDTAFVFGGGIRWRDEDLKYLIGSIPLGN